MAAKEKHIPLKKTKFSVPLMGLLRQWPPTGNMEVRDTAPSLWKISAKSIQQFWRRCVPNTHNDIHTNSKLNILLLPWRS